MWSRCVIEPHRYNKKASTPIQPGDVIVSIEQAKSKLDMVNNLKTKNVVQVDIVRQALDGGSRSMFQNTRLNQELEKYVIMISISDNRQHCSKST